MKNVDELVYQFKITLRDIRPPIWRRIQVPADYSFWDLHVAIQDAMGWEDSHLHAFFIINPKTGVEEEIGNTGDNFPDEGSIELVRRLKLSQYFTSENSKALYEYDFGDDWLHDIVLEKILPIEKNVEYPVCIAGKRHCPPEDCGGPLGYMDILKILSNPDDDEYEEIIEWLGPGFDPEYFDPKETEFIDPEKEWQYAYGDSDEMDEFDDEAEGSADEDMSEARLFSRKYIHGIWERAKTGDLRGLSTEEKRMAGILMDHEDEYFNEFEFSDLTSDHDYDPQIESNPFLHVFLHSIVENQLAEREPIEVFQFYNAMRKKKSTHHEAIHLVGAILTPLMFQTMKERRPFDVDGYRSLLKKYKTRNPDKIFDQLSKDFEPDVDE
jgi:hypothetical protein